MVAFLIGGMVTGMVQQWTFLWCERCRKMHSNTLINSWGLATEIFQMIQMFFLNIISTNKKLIVLPLFVLPTFVYILIVTYLIDVLPFVYLLICISIYIYYIYIHPTKNFDGWWTWFSSLQLCLRLVAWGIPETQADNFWRSFWSRGRMASWRKLAGWFCFQIFF